MTGYRFRKGATMNNELKPCPFCGGEAEVWECEEELDILDPQSLGYLDTKYCTVHCVGCEVCEIVIGRAKKDEAINAWNTRAERTCHPVEKFSEDSPFPVMVCSECGRPLHYDEYREMDYQPYCGCGAKVVE